MARSCWGLLVACWLVFFAAGVLRGQDGATRPGEGGQAAPELPSLRYPLPTAPVWIPPPNLRRHSPVAPGTIALRQDALQQLVHAAGIIFAGRVTLVGRDNPSAGPNPASTAVTFQIEHALRGAAAGQSLTIHEWAGLWTGGERYRVGDHVLLFLYAPGKLGLTSPVSGAMGRFALDSEGKIVMGPLQMAIFAADPVLGGKNNVTFADVALAVRRLQIPATKKE